MDTDAERQLALLASALEQANTTLRERMDELSLVRRVGDAVSRHTSNWSLCSELVQAIAQTINCKYILIYTRGGGGFQLQAVSSVFSEMEPFPQTLSGSRLSRHLEQTSEPLFLADVKQSGEWQAGWPFPSTLTSWLFVPLLTRNDLRGALCLADDLPGAFSASTLRTLMMIVPQIASALANIGLYDHLRESELKYRTLVIGMQDVVYICDQEWRILESNPAAELLFGEPIIGKTLLSLFSFPETAGAFQEAMTRSNRLQDFEAFLTGSRQERRLTLLSCVREAGRCSGIIKDITERARLYEQVARAKQMESIGTLASGVAHDFNNILGIILPHAELIQARLESDSPSQKFVDAIINASKRASQVTRQLLSLARKDPGVLKVIDLNEMIRSTGRLLEETFERRIRLEFDLAPGPLCIKADETQIEQVLLNLSINARDAMPEGGVLTFSTHDAQDAVRLRITDTGIGIDPAHFSRIFDPFFTTKESSKGTGLGLSIVYRIVKDSGGNIEVQSEPAKGTQFLLTFPAVPVALTSSSSSEPQPGEGSERILIVEDEPVLLEMLHTILTERGYSVISATNGKEALEVVSADVDLVILDMLMPVMNGSAALKAIRERFPQMKVLISSGYIAPDHMAVLNRLGVEGCVQKPFQIHKLASIVRQVLDEGTRAASET